MIDTTKGMKNLDEYLKSVYHSKQKTQTRSSIALTTFDPIAVGEKAKQYRADQWAAGIEVSATDAVRHVMDGMNG